jgi:acetyl esterase/lipase
LNTSILVVLAGMLLPFIAGASPPDGASAYKNPQDADLVRWLPESEPSARLNYGGDSPLQYADLRLPPGRRPSPGYPVIVFIHGGAFLSEWTKDPSDPLAEALSNLGFAVWSIEYRRLGNTGGGFPNTFKDVMQGTDALRQVAGTYHLDLTRVIAVGHSAGGQLALLLAERRHLPIASALYSPNPVALKGVIGLSPTTDYATAVQHRPGTLAKMGVPVSDAQAFYDQVSPLRLLPLGVPTWIIDETVDLNGETGFTAWYNPMNRAFVRRAADMGDTIQVLELDGANHYDLIDPHGPAFGKLKAAVLSLLPPSK